MRIEQVTKMQTQGRVESKEAKTAFRDMMQALENVGSKDMPKRKEASEHKEVATDKKVIKENSEEVLSKEDSRKSMENSGETISSEKGKVASELEKSVSTDTNLLDFKKLPLIDEKTMDEEEKQGSELPEEMIFEHIRPTMQDTKHESVVADQKLESEKSDLKNPQLQKQLDNAWMLKPEIKEMSREAKTTLDLQKEIQSVTGKDVEISFEKELNKTEGKEVLEEVISPSLQRSKAEQVEVIKIKVGEPDQIAPKVMQKLQEKIQILQTGEKSYEIELDPENLGKISVKIHFGEKATAVEMLFNNKKTMELMAKHIDQLTDGLQNAKGTTVNIQMSEQMQPDYLDQQEQQQQQERQQKEEQRKSDEFINQIKQSLREEAQKM